MLLQNLLEQKGVLLADGATGSNLFDMGLQTGDSPEFWNDLYPERIAAHYRSFVEAGSDIILTNTFGGNSYRLKLHKAEDRVEELNIKAVQLLKLEVEKVDREIVVAGSIGPTGEMIEPLGSVTHDEAVAAFRQQAEALKTGGVDVFWIETLSSQEEARAAAEACSGLGLPIVTTYSIDTNGRTMMGLSADDIVTNSEQMNDPLFAIGSNCGVGASELVAAILNLKTAIEKNDSDQSQEMVIVAKANCGIPEYKEGKIVYNGTEAIMADYARLAIDAGARIIGGCCGTTPDHVRAMRKAIDNHNKGTLPTLDDITNQLGELSTGAIAQLEGKLAVADGSASKIQKKRKSRRQK